MYAVEIWADSNPDNLINSVAVKVAETVLQQNEKYEGLFSGSLKCDLPSGLTVSVTCERVPTGHWHVGISHNSDFISSGKYIGPFTLRMFPQDHPSYVLDIKVIE